MKLLACIALLVLTLGVIAGEKGLLGEDDVDKKHAEMATNSTKTDSPKPSNPMKEAKKRVKDDKKELEELQERARALKEQLRDSKQLSKTEKKALKRDFRVAKNDLNNKKQELNSLKAEIKVLKSEKQSDKMPTLSPPEGRKSGKSKSRGGNRKNKHKPELIGAEEDMLNNPEETGLQIEPAMEEEEESILSRKEQKKLMRKMSRKATRKENRKANKGDDLTADENAADKPRLRTGDILPRRAKKQRGSRNHNRVHCATDSDCLGGAVCFENHKGHKFCKSHGRNKAAGKKCHRVHQCAEGLQCFVTNTDVTSKHKKPRGICADPLTADLSKGAFLESVN